MKLFFALTLLLQLCFSRIGRAQDDHHFRVGGKEVRIDSFNMAISGMIDTLGVPAASIAIIDDDKLVFSGNYGFKRWNKKDPVNDNTVFEACSLSKMFLLFVVEQLADSGRIDLEKPLYQYVPNPRLEHDPRYKKITARMVLSHSSGIENWQEDNNKDTLEILSDPGTKFVYSGEGYQYLAKVVESILHEPYETYITRRVLGPFQLENTYLKFNEDSVVASWTETPGNYTLGHRAFGNEIPKWKNTIPVPASGINTTASDYARLLMAFFDTTRLSAARMKDRIKPVIRMDEGNANFYMGSGFMMIDLPKDTLICFSGIDDGFRSEIFFSVIHRRGFVYFTNSSNGDLMIGQMNRLTAGFDMDSLLAMPVNRQYPSVAIDILRVYREKGAAEMFAAVERSRQQRTLDEGTLPDVAMTFLGFDNTIAQKCLDENKAWYPQSALTWCLLGQVYTQEKNYKMALSSFSKAKELKFDRWDIDESIKECQQQMSRADLSKKQ